MTAITIEAATIPNALTGARRPDIARSSDAIMPSCGVTGHSHELIRQNDVAFMKHASTAPHSEGIIAHTSNAVGPGTPGHIGNIVGTNNLDSATAS